MSQSIRSKDGHLRFQITPKSDNTSSKSPRATFLANPVKSEKIIQKFC